MNLDKEYFFADSYRNNDILRKSFNNMAKRTFDIDFEQWYRQGYWKERFNPNSIFNKEGIISNVSVNTMNFNENGVTKHYIQLGTVMTKDGYRNKGFCRKLIEKIIDQYSDKCDGIYLFANDSVLNFYPKFGFKKVKEYEYFKNINNNNHRSVIRVDMNFNINVEKFINAIEKSGVNSQLKNNNMQIVMFYITLFMKDCVYYLPEEDAYIVAEENGDELFIHDIYCERQIDINNVIKAFGIGFKKAVLGFTPIYKEGFGIREIDEEDTTLFVLGKDFDSFKNSKKRFPSLSHT